jgi:hypothetical protein
MLEFAARLRALKNLTEQHTGREFGFAAYMGCPRAMFGLYCNRAGTDKIATRITSCPQTGDSQSLTFAGVERKPPDGEPLRLNQEEAQ